jgi:hypothetical protein
MLCGLLELELAVEAAPPIFNWVMKGEGKEDVVAQDELSEW